MPIWNRVKQELDRAGKAAQDALDEGKVRLDALRVRQLADKAAQALGYAVYRARASGAELEADTYERLRQTLAGHEAEASRLEAQLEDLSRKRKDRSPAGATPDAAGPATTAERPADTPGGTV
jgi:hypothetical protein